MDKDLADVMMEVSYLKKDKAALLEQIRIKNNLISDYFDALNWCLEQDWFRTNDFYARKK